jgi:tripartite-type tricarboxylate transporter receptor subunit TctC
MTLCRRMRACLAVASLSFGVHAPGGAALPEPPAGVLRIVVTANVGSGMDSAARIIAEFLRTSQRQAAIVDNRPGADGIIATRLVIAAPADGQTLLLASNGQIAITPLLHDPVPFDGERDLAPVTLVARWPLVLVVSSMVPVRTVAELVARARESPDGIDCGSASSNYQLATEMFQRLTGARLRHIPYNGVAATVNALAAGDVQVAILNLNVALPLIRAGKLRALAVNTESRQASAPDVPTFAEAGVQGFDFGIWAAVYAPAGTSPVLMGHLRETMARALADDEVRARFAAGGMQVVGGSPDAVREGLARDRARYGALARAIRDANRVDR